jgi:hypothetical protein
MLKFLYTAILVLCVSAYASSNECLRHGKTGHPTLGSLKTITEEKPGAEAQEDQGEFSTFQFVKYLYL